MPDQKLFFNIIPFNFPEEDQTFYFSLEESRTSTRIHRSLFPNDIETIFPGIKAKGTEFVHTTFKFPKEGFTPLAINFLTENEDLIHKYYNNIIYHYFKRVKKRLIRRNYVGDNQVWLQSSILSTKKVLVFHKFTLKIQLYNVSFFPELVISYDGKARIYNTTIGKLTKQVSPSLLSWVVQDKILVRFSELQKKGIVDFEKIFPVLTNPLAIELECEQAPAKKENKYTIYKNNLEILYNSFLNQPEFKELVDLHDSGFLPVDAYLVDSVDDSSNVLEYCNEGKGRVPKTDFRWKKPFKGVTETIHIFYIYHKDHQVYKDLLQTYLESGFTKAYKGLTDYAGILFKTQSDRNICFQNQENPMIEIEQFFKSHPPLNKSIRYLAMYVTPYNKIETSKQEVRTYVRLKEFLLRRNIACQSVEPATIDAPKEGFKWSLTTMSISILAKLGGIPWQLASSKEKNEMVVGVGAFKHPDGVQYLSSAFCFDFTGQFNEFEYFLKHQTNLLAGSIAAKITEFTTTYGIPSRLIIHFYKERMKASEIAPIEEALQKLGLSIPVFIIHVNKTDAKDIIAYDIGWKDYWMPFSGTFISINSKKYLLFNNSRHEYENFNTMEGYPFPIKLSIDCNDKKQLENKTVIKELINQVYQFSRIYFKSLTQQNLPVTVKYPEIIAQLTPYMENPDLPPLSKNHLWFL